MHILFCHDTSYSKRRDGTVYSYGGFPYEVWQEQFLQHFDSMTIIGRKKKLRPDETGVLDVSSGKGVDHILLPNIHSPVKRLTKYTRMYHKIADQVSRADAVVVRGPVEFGVMAAKAAREQGKPYAVEMCGCAYDKTYYQGDLFNRIYAPVKFRRVQNMVRHANAVMYVTEQFLQSRYPTQGKKECASHVEIEMPPKDILNKRLHRIEHENKNLNIGLVGSFVDGMKGVDVAIEALAIAQAYRQEHPEEDIPEMNLKILGQGVAAQWQGLINQHNLQSHVEFCGKIARGDGVYEWLDNIDVYIQPSFHEGLPRSLIEAMSRGCPALASDAGGTREVLSSEFIHDRGNAQKLADHILSFVTMRARVDAARHNFEKSKNYTREILVPKKQAFWSDFVETVQKSNVSNKN
ncbi:MAG: glycosyltransferase [Alphaproteobacteria bacterium]